jgi:hypothetical protein
MIVNAIIAALLSLMALWDHELNRFFDKSVIAIFALWIVALREAPDAQ